MNFFNYKSSSGRNVRCLHFNNMEQCSAAPVKHADSWKKTIARDEEFNRRTNWFGLPSRVQLVKAASEGWEDGEARMREMGEELLKDEEIIVGQSVSSHKRRKRRRGDHGMSIDMDRVYNGQLDTAWTRMQHVQKVMQSPKNVCVYIDVACLGGVKPSETLWRGAVAFIITDILIKEGYSVKVVVGGTSRDVLVNDTGNDVTCTSVTIKDYMSGINPKTLAVACSAGYHRHFNFRMRNMFDKPPREDYGKTIKDHTILPEDLRRDVEAGVKVIHIDNDLCSKYSAKTKVKAVLEDLRKDVVTNLVQR